VSSSPAGPVDHPHRCSLSADEGSGRSDGPQARPRTVRRAQLRGGPRPARYIASEPGTARGQPLVPTRCSTRHRPDCHRHRVRAVARPTCPAGRTRQPRRCSIRCRRCDAARSALCRGLRRGSSSPPRHSWTAVRRQAGPRVLVARPVPVAGSAVRHTNAKPTPRRRGSTPRSTTERARQSLADVHQPVHGRRRMWLFDLDVRARCVESATGCLARPLAHRSDIRDNSRAGRVGQFGGGGVRPGPGREDQRGHRGREQVRKPQRERLCALYTGSPWGLLTIAVHRLDQVQDQRRGGAARVDRRLGGHEDRGHLIRPAVLGRCGGEPCVNVHVGPRFERRGAGW
jgi:hypothetical protein